MGNIKNCELCARKISEVATTSKIVVEKSTVPVRTAQAITRVLQANEKGLTFPVLSNPEFLAEGTAITDLLNPDRVLIGGQQNEAGLKAAETLVSVYANWVPREQILTTNLWSSELSKLVANAFLAQRVSSINAVAKLCERTGADVTEVSRAIGSDARIGPKFLNASIGFGGSCFQKDILNLVYICEQFGLHEVAAYWQQVVDTNEYQKKSFTVNIIHTLFNTVTNKKIAVFGFAFKKDTGDVRETPALTVCHMLAEDGAYVHVYDPKVKRAAAIEEFTIHGMEVDDEHFILTESPEDAVKDAHAIVVLTEWDCFKTYDYSKFYTVMQKPAFVFDGRNMLDHGTLESIGFEVCALGKGSTKTKAFGEAPRPSVANLVPNAELQCK